MAFDTVTGELTENEHRPDIRPSANSQFIVRDRETDHDFVLVEEEFVGDTEADVKQQVEAWANQQFQKLVAVLQAAFHYGRPG